MSHHIVFGDTLIFSEKRPNRSRFLFFTRNYSLFVGILVTIIIGISSFQYTPIWSTTAIIAYWTYWFVVRSLARNEARQLLYQSQAFQLARSILLILITSIFLDHIYTGTNYLNDKGTNDTLWLLYVLAVFIMCQYGITKWVITVTSLASFCLIAINIHVNHNLDYIFLANLAVKITWLILLSFVLHVLIRLISDRSANLRLLHDVQKRVMEIRSVGEENQLLKAVADSIASSFDYPDVNVFEKQQDGKLRCVAAASKRGNKLVESHFEMTSDQGIIGQVMEIGKSHVANDTINDVYFLAHEAFPRTKAELVVPIRVAAKTIGVLDIQVHQHNVFLDEDKEVMEILADHVGRLWDDTRQTNSLLQIIEGVSRRFLSRNDLNATLKEIVQAAKEILHADIVVLYEYNSLYNKVTFGALAGEVYHPEKLNGSIDRTFPLIHRILSANDEPYFQNDVQSEHDHPLFKRQDDQLCRNDQPFAVREKIVSRAVVRLKSELDNAGVMFLNFRSRHIFDEQEKKKLSIISQLAALAIKKAQSQQEEIKSEREDLAWQLHDQIMANTFGIAKLTSSLLTDKAMTTSQQRRLSIMQEAIQELTRNIRYLHNNWKDTSMGNICDEVSKIIISAKETYHANFKIECNSNTNLPRYLINQIKLVINEAIVNAINYGEATNIELIFEVSSDYLDMIITDNGKGFDINAVEMRGLAYMQKRLERLGGTRIVDSMIGSGTRLSISVPIQ